MIHKIKSSVLILFAIFAIAPQSNGGSFWKRSSPAEKKISQNEEILAKKHAIVAELAPLASREKQELFGFDSATQEMLEHILLEKDTVVAPPRDDLHSYKEKIFKKLYPEEAEGEDAKTNMKNRDEELTLYTTLVLKGTDAEKKKKKLDFILQCAKHLQANPQKKAFLLTKFFNKEKIKEILTQTINQYKIVTQKYEELTKNDENLTKEINKDTVTLEEIKIFGFFSAIHGDVIEKIEKFTKRKFPEVGGKQEIEAFEKILDGLKKKKTDIMNLKKNLENTLASLKDHLASDAKMEIAKIQKEGNFQELKTAIEKNLRKKAPLWWEDHERRAELRSLREFAFHNLNVEFETLESKGQYVEIHKQLGAVKQQLAERLAQLETRIYDTRGFLMSKKDYSSLKNSFMEINNRIEKLRNEIALFVFAKKLLDKLQRISSSKKKDYEKISRELNSIIEKLPQLIKKEKVNYDKMERTLKKFDETLKRLNRERDKPA